MNVLVTGATGFLGKQLALKLRSQSHQVIGLGRDRFIGQQLEADNIKFLAIDLRDREAIIEACKGQDYIFHCGALSSPWGKYQDFYDTNVLGTRNIIQGCQTHHVKRLIYVSTASVYFDFVDRLNIPEQTVLPTPVNAYAQSKQLAEWFTRNYDSTSWYFWGGRYSYFTKIDSGKYSNWYPPSS
jgi:nucleoside-diphosphate-sugar epimerase